MRGRRILGFGLSAGLLAASLAVVTDVAPAAAADGGLDPAFGSGGSVTLPTLATGSAVGRQADGKIVVAGKGQASGSSVAVTRRGADGTLDPTFGTGGTATTERAAWGNVKVKALAVQADGKIVVALEGDESQSGFITSDVYLLRYTAAGQPDATFGTGGLVQASAGGDDTPEALLVQPDGKILVAGSSDFDPEGTGFVKRFLANGQRDDAFGTLGQVTVEIPVADFFDWTYVKALALQPNGRIVLAGAVHGVNEDGSTVTKGLVARLTAAGDPDATFDGDGFATPTIAPSGFFMSVVAAPDGDIVAAGHNVSDVIVWRYTTAGALDSGFSGDGKVTLPGVASGFTNERAALDADGRLILVGTTPDGHLRVARVTAAGSPDPDFGVDGVAVGPAAVVWDGGLEPSGNVLVAATAASAGRLFRVSNPTTAAADLVVTDVSWTPAAPDAGDGVRFSATIKNVGDRATPAGAIHGVAFCVDGTKVTWSDTSIASLAPGASVVLTANGGGSAGLWAATAGDHAVTAKVDDLDRIPGEADETNNSRSEALTVGDGVLPVDGDFTPSATRLLTGAAGGGSAAALAADDGSYFEVDSTTTGTRTAAWYGGIPKVPNDLESLDITYRGSNSVAADQTISIFNWSTGAWVDLDTRTVTSETQIKVTPPGSATTYVSASTGTGTVRVRISATAAGDFTSTGDLLKVTVE